MRVNVFRVVRHYDEYFRKAHKERKQSLFNAEFRWCAIIKALEGHRMIKKDTKELLHFLSTVQHAPSQSAKLQRAKLPQI